MRNLKKVMALALATVMLLGIMVMGAGAADYKAYKDAASVDAKYELAVEMLKEIGVFEGDNNGNLNAKNTLTRGEAAKVIATLKLTKATATKIGAPIAAPFADVAVSDWYAPFVAYCKDLGIISGVGDNKFDPNGTLTGYAFAKMLLGVLGYKAENEGFTGASWDTNVNLAALQGNLLTGLSINLADAITREQAIQMAYNTLMANMVKYASGGFNISTPDGFQFSSNAGDRETLKATLLTSLYGETYKPGTSETAIGLPTTTWTKAGKIVAETAAYSVVKTYTGAIATVKASTLYTDAGLTAEVKNVPVYANTTANLIGVVDLNKTGAAIAAVAKYNGATMSLIKAGDEYAILVEFATLVKAGKPVAATASAKAYVPVTVDSKELKIETVDYKENDLLAVTVNKAGDKVLTHKKAALETGVISEITKNGEVVVNGAKYAFAGSEVGTAATPDKAALDGKTKFTYVIENGYIYAETANPVVTTKASLEGVYYLAGYTAPVADAWGNSVTFAQLVDLATGDVTIDTKVENTTAAAGAFYTKKDADKNGKYTFEAFTGKDSDGKQSIYVEALKDTSIKTTAKAVNTADKKVYFTANSTILTITGKEDKLAAGFKSAPADIDVATSKAAAQVIFTKTKAGAYEVAMIVFVSDKALVANTTTVYAGYYVLPGSNGSVYNADAKAVFEKMNVIDLKTLEKSEVLVAKAVTGYADGTVNKYGAYEFTAKTPTTAAVVAAGTTASLYNNMLTVDMKVNGEDVVDYDVTNVKVLNPLGIKDKDNKNAITTVAEILAAKCEFAIDTNKTTDTVNYIIVISK